MLSNSRLSFILPVHDIFYDTDNGVKYLLPSQDSNCKMSLKDRFPSTDTRQIQYLGQLG